MQALLSLDRLKSNFKFEKLISFDRMAVRFPVRFRSNATETKEFLIKHYQFDEPFPSLKISVRSNFIDFFAGKEKSILGQNFQKPSSCLQE